MPVGDWWQRDPTGEDLNNQYKFYPLMNTPEKRSPDRIRSADKLKDFDVRYIIRRGYDLTFLSETKDGIRRETYLISAQAIRQSSSYPPQTIVLKTLQAVAVRYDPFDNGDWKVDILSRRVRHG